MGFWKRSIGSSSKPPSFPPPASPFEDRPPIRRMLYYFQHYALREASFMRDERLTESIAAGRIEDRFAAYLWAKSAIFAAMAGAIPSALLPPLMPKSPADPAQQALDEGVKIAMAIAIHSRRVGEFTAISFDMPTPEYVAEAHFLAIVYRGEDSAATPKYFTLERRSGDGDPPVICEWTADGVHHYRGEYLIPERDSFARNVLSRSQADGSAG